MPGVIAAGDPETARAGAMMLERGGNAVDAAVAGAFASFVAEVGVVHLGGSGMAQICLPALSGSRPEGWSYDFFSATPGLGHYGRPGKLDFEKVTVDFGPTTQDFFLGRGSVAVPGNIFGLCRMAEEYGRLPLEVLLAPAIALARDGVNLTRFQADTCALLSPLYTHTAEMRAIFAPGGRLIQSSDRLFIDGLAQTLEELASSGPETLRTGRLAGAVLADQQANGGLITADDLARYEVRRDPPIRVEYRQHELWFPPPSSAGGAMIAFSLALLEGLDPGRLTYHSSRHLQLLCEVMAATARARPLWDDLFEQLGGAAAVESFLDRAHVAEYANQVVEAMNGKRPLMTQHESAPFPETSHLSVIDSQGMAVSLTTTAGESAGYVVPGTGFIPNNMLGEADLHPAGFHSRPPGQRIPTMMAPTIALRDGRIRLVTGSGGSIRIRSAILQVLSNFLDFDMALTEAVYAPRVHLEDGVLQCERGVDSGGMDGLEAIGYAVRRWDRRSIYFGGAHSVAVLPDGRLAAAGDDRRGGAAASVL
jgi:gamma-glutamyltranspeptidase/glutathione hydrolase